MTAVVVGIWCDGDTERHDPVPVFLYRRLVDEKDGSHVWAPVYSTNTHKLVENQRVWLDADNNPVPAAQVLAGVDARPHDTFTCSVCGFNIPRRWDDVEKLLDGLYRMPRPRVMLREWDEWIKAGWIK